MRPVNNLKQGQNMDQEHSKDHENSSNIILDRLSEVEKLLQELELRPSTSDLPPSTLTQRAIPKSPFIRSYSRQEDKKDKSTVDDDAKSTSKLM